MLQAYHELGKPLPTIPQAYIFIPHDSSPFLISWETSTDKFHHDLEQQPRHKLLSTVEAAFVRENALGHLARLHCVAARDKTPSPRSKGVALLQRDSSRITRLQQSPSKSRSMWNKLVTPFMLNLICPRFGNSDPNRLLLITVATPRTS